MRNMWKIVQQSEDESANQTTLRIVLDNSVMFALAAIASDQRPYDPRRNLFKGTFPSTGLTRLQIKTLNHSLRVASFLSFNSDKLM